MILGKLSQDKPDADPLIRLHLTSFPNEAPNEASGRAAKVSQHIGHVGLSLDQLSCPLHTRLTGPQLKNRFGR